MPDAWGSLKGEKYINLTTFRKNGVGVSTPVWFAELDGHLVVYTTGGSGKVKRIRHTSRVELAASDARGNIRGPRIPGIARIVAPAEEQRVEALLNRKYPLKHVLNLFSRLRRTARTYLEISPA